jgi:hypothetical protein
MSENEQVRPLLTVLVFGAAVCSAQFILPPSKVPGAVKEFDPSYDEIPLNCHVSAVKPAIDFSFRFHAGYVVRVPLKLYFGANHTLGVLTRLTPADTAAKPVFLISATKLPNIPKSRSEIEIAGSYLLGEGRYTVDLLMFDDSGRRCRKHWIAEAKLGRNERNVTLRIPPGRVRSLYTASLPPAAPKPTGGSKILRLTVLLHATPLYSRATKIRAYDREVLLGSLASLLERVPSASIRLVVFNLAQQKKIYTDDRFTAARLTEAGASMNQLQLGLVQYEVLQNTHGHLALLAALVNDELAAQEPSDAIIFLGPASPYLDALPKTLFENRQNAGPEFFYLQYRPSVLSARRATPHGGPEFPDSIQSLMKRLHGKTFTVHSPGEFATAIAQIENRTAPKP